jgi:hypothetical protein
MIARWLIGLSLGTLIIAATSPWFVRSYVPRRYDELRHRVLLSPGESYRWRAEGYATSEIGPHGMMGRTTLTIPTPDPATQPAVFALWGDSQAEGVCVSDSRKLWRQMQAELQEQADAGNQFHSVQVLPLANSGDDVANWVAELNGTETGLGVSEHIILLCEMVDLMVLIEDPEDLPALDPTSLARANLLTRWTPDFVLHAGRNLLTDPNTLGPRRLRFGIGPVHRDAEPTPIHFEAEIDRAAAERWILSNLAALRDATNKPIWIVYAPRCPVIMDGRLRWSDPDEVLWAMVQQHAAEHAINLIDCRPAFRASVRQGIFPHGYQNGRIGNGHLNSVGYRMIAREFANHWKGVEGSESWRVSSGEAE